MANKEPKTKSYLRLISQAKAKTSCFPGREDSDPISALIDLIAKQVVEEQSGYEKGE